MNFSQRFGYVSKDLQRATVSPALKMRIWNILYKELIYTIQWPLSNEKVYHFFEKCWDLIFKRDVSDFRAFDRIVRHIEISKVYTLLKWNTIFDLIEEVLKEFSQKNLAEKFNTVLKEEGSAYRIINNQVVEITSEQEIIEIEKVFSQPDKFTPVKNHLDKGLKYLSNREKPDYENSIKESISALESLTKIITGRNETLGILIKELKIHSALKDSISKMYGWASDNGGIRHGSGVNDLKSDESESRLILVFASSLINYIISKQVENEAAK